MSKRLRELAGEHLLWKGPRRLLFLEHPGEHLHGFAVEVSDGTGFWLLPSGRYAIPERMTLHLLDDRYPKVDLDLELDEGALVCSAIRRQPDSPALSGRLLRAPFPVEAIIQEAAQNVAVAVKESRDGSLTGRWVRLGGEAKLKAFLGEYGTVRPKRGQPKGQEHYETVAQVCQVARANGGSPIRAIMDELHASKTTALRWKKEAERRGLLARA